MQFCDDHWTRLRKAIDDRGLGALVPDSGEQAASNLENLLETQQPTIDNFDPLMNAQWAIVSNLGMEILYIDGCPLCYANAEHAKDKCEDCEDPEHGYDKWIDFAADDQLDAYKQLTEV
jgi:hypothetical protein